MLSNGIWERLEILAFCNYTRTLFFCNYAEPLCVCKDIAVSKTQSSLMGTKVFLESDGRHVYCQVHMCYVQNQLLGSATVQALPETSMVHYLFDSRLSFSHLESEVMYC